MFLPPAVDIPDTQEDASLPLKKILMWNGVSSWGGVRPGRGEFIKQECPVSTCAIVMDRGQAEQVDMVLFKDPLICLLSRGHTGKYGLSSCLVRYVNSLIV